MKIWHYLINNAHTCVKKDYPEAAINPSTIRICHVDFMET